MQSQELVRSSPTTALLQYGFTEDEIGILKDQIMPGASDSELKLFGMVCGRTGLDPFKKQIYSIGRKKKMPNGEFKVVYTTQTSIEGFRSIAEKSGEYAGQTPPLFCGTDGVWAEAWLKKEPPTACRIGVHRKGFKEPLVRICKWDEYVETYYDRQSGTTTISGEWKSRPCTMLQKCFSEDTEVLTIAGFQRFDSVKDTILQVTSDGLWLARGAEPFCQEYDGDMVVSNGDMLNFSVTPNHDMITTFGTVEAGAMLATTTTRGPWRIPLIPNGRASELLYDGLSISDADLSLAGYIAACGYNHGNRFNIAVSKPRKIEALESMGATSTYTQRCAGETSKSATRTITSNFDKKVFTFEMSRVSQIIDKNKNFDVCRLMHLSQRQARILFDAWQYFDGHTNNSTGKRQIFSANPHHWNVIELLAVLSGYTINRASPHNSDISVKHCVAYTISSAAPPKVYLPTGGHPGIVIEKNTSGKVWCVTVPSGAIIVRRNGFSMVCGNCTEASALRAAFSNEEGDLLLAEEHLRSDAEYDYEVEDKPIPNKGVNSLLDRLPPDQDTVDTTSAPLSVTENAQTTERAETPEPAPEERITSIKNKLTELKWTKQVVIDTLGVYKVPGLWTHDDCDKLKHWCDAHEVLSSADSATNEIVDTVSTNVESAPASETVLTQAQSDLLAEFVGNGGTFDNMNNICSKAYTGKTIEQAFATMPELHIKKVANLIEINKSKAIKNAKYAAQEDAE